MPQRRVITIPQLIFIVIVVILTTTISVLAATGTTDSTNAPGLSASYTLEDIYVRLVNGTAGSQSTFNEPAVAPGTGSMHDLNDIMAAAPAQDNTNGATAAEVQAGNTFWGLTNGEWGPQTGQRYGGCVCEGHMVGDTGTRWCDNEDGTIIDLHNNCLVWLKDATVINPDIWFYAMNFANINGSGHNGLSDGSYKFDWRVPTYSNYRSLTRGIDPVSSSNQQGFIGLRSDWYWTSDYTASSDGDHRPYIFHLTTHELGPDFATNSYYYTFVRDNKQ